MDRQAAHEYAAAMAHAQQQQQQQPPPYGYHQQQFPPPPQQLPHGSPPFMNPAHHPSMQQHQFPFHRHLPPLPQQQQQLGPLHLHQHHPSLLHMHLLLPPSSPSHGPSGSFPYQFDSAPPPVAPPPSDPELHKCIDKLVEYVSKNGPDFEVMIREKQHNNPIYAFLFGGEGHGYYRYKLWLSTRGGPPGSPFNSPFSSSMGVVPPQLLNPPPSAGGGPHLHQQFPPYHDQQPQPPHSHPSLGYDHPKSSFKGLSGPLPSDVAAELSSVLHSLTGTKESIKGAKMWFMQRSPFAPALAEALRERMFLLDDSERQMHIIFLANDILFDSLQRRHVQQELDNVALAFKPVLGPMLSRIYGNPQNRESNQSRLEKIVQFWASKEVFDQETIHALEDEMTQGSYHPGGLPELPSAALQDPSAAAGEAAPPSCRSATLAGLPIRGGGAIPAAAPHLRCRRIVLPGGPGSAAGGGSGVGEGGCSGSAATVPTVPTGADPGHGEEDASGQRRSYSPISPLDIPTVIPPSTASPSELLERVSKFFKEIGEENPSEGPMRVAAAAEGGDYDWEPPPRMGGACIPPPAALQAGLGAAAADPNEVSQYDDVYSSYRKQRSSNYHSSMSARSSSSSAR
ncbi:unnamed protein product [Spirodela intermedia]|uniref:Uncharacterized protein n=1 Tax=Spirodela intermedia TaxID=51605 RepID=A0A7I8IKB9_SPIIN|nr:unnamed protein product [Spirodela intermedia]CAA6658301.1 unnamed protein product [Spirodela intermedia]